MSGNAEIQMEIEEIVAHTNDTGDEYACNQIMEGEEGYEECNGAGDHCRARAGDQDEVHIAMMRTPLGAFKYELPGEDIINGDGDEEGEGG